MPALHRQKKTKLEQRYDKKQTLKRKANNELRQRGAVLVAVMDKPDVRRLYPSQGPQHVEVWRRGGTNWFSSPPRWLYNILYIQGGPKVGLHLVGMHFTFYKNILLHLYVFVTIIFVQYCLCTFI